MLAIERVPIYRNKLFLSTMSVLTGFIMTVGIIRAVSPIDTSSQQSVLPESDRRATSLIPIRASSSESSSESGDSKGNASAGAGTNTSVSTPNHSVSATSSGQLSSSTSSGNASTQSTPQSGSTQTTASGSQSLTSTNTKTTKPAETSPVCLATVLSIGLICH